MTLFSRAPDRPLSPSTGALLAGMSAPLLAQGLGGDGRARLLAAAARAGLLDGSAPSVSVGRGAFGLRLAGVSVAAAALVVILAESSQPRATEVAGWQPLHAVPAPTPAVRVVDDAGDAFLGAASLANASLDPLETP